ncbi:PH domain-containing protein, partial [Pseudomonas silesiensis]|uniref:PH domain-containing protein n=1 Tax=Pseudomonas silesiensis TaxID=1853130 RepID=UPI0034D62D10
PDPVKICDICNGLLINKRSHAFSLISKQRSRPLNLAADSEEQMKAWVSALTQAFALDSKEDDHTGGQESTNIVVPSSSSSSS